MKQATSHKIIHGMLAGLIASGVFGIIMMLLTPATLGKIAALYGGEAQLTGFLIHLIHGVLIGGLFAALTSGQISRLRGSWYGFVYGVAWWVAGPILIMPTWLGAGPRLSAEGVQAALPSLTGHIVFGLILGFLFIVLIQNEAARAKSAGQSNQ